VRDTIETCAQIGGEKFPPDLAFGYHGPRQGTTLDNWARSSSMRQVSLRDSDSRSVIQARRHRLRHSARQQTAAVLAWSPDLPTDPSASL